MTSLNKKLPKKNTTSLWTDQVLQLVQQVLEGDEGALCLHVRVRCEVAPRARLLGAVALLDAEHVAHTVGNRTREEQNTMQNTSPMLCRTCQHAKQAIIIII